MPKPDAFDTVQLCKLAWTSELAYQIKKKHLSGGSTFCIIFYRTIFTKIGASEKRGGDHFLLSSQVVWGRGAGDFVKPL